MAKLFVASAIVKHMTMTSLVVQMINTYNQIANINRPIYIYMDGELVGLNKIREIV